MFLSSAGSLVGHPAGYPGSVLGDGLHHLPLQPHSRHRWHLAFPPPRWTAIPVWRWKLNIVNIHQLCSTRVCVKEVTGEDTPVPRCHWLNVILQLPFLFLVCIEQQHSFYVFGKLDNCSQMCGQSEPGTAINLFAPRKKGLVVAFDLILPPCSSNLNSTVITVKINGLRLFIAVALNIIMTWD